MFEMQLFPSLLYLGAQKGLWKEQKHEELVPQIETDEGAIADANVEISGNEAALAAPSLAPSSAPSTVLAQSFIESPVPVSFSLQSLLDFIPFSSLVQGIRRCCNL